MARAVAAPTGVADMAVVAVAATAAGMAEDMEAMAMDTVAAVATAVAKMAVAAVPPVATIEGPAPICAATGTESVPGSMGRRRLFGSRA